MEDTVTYNDTISIPHLSVIDVECPYIGYVKDSNGDVEIVNGGSSSFESIIWQKAFDNEIGCYKPSYYDKGNYELKIVYSINPPVEYDDQYQHVNIKLANDHIPYKNVRIVIDDPENDVVELFSHPPMEKTKTGDQYILTGSSPSDNIIEFEIVAKNIRYGFPRFEDNIMDKTVSANSGYNTAYTLLTGLYYLLMLFTVGFGGIIFAIYYFKGREKDFVVPEYLNHVPKTLKNTVSKYIIDVNFKDEIFDLKKSNSEKTGVRNILRPKQTILYILLTLLPVNNKLFRKLLLKIISPKKKKTFIKIA